MQNPGYLRYFVLERHLLGLVTAGQPHGKQPWWYYLPILLGGGLPWIGYLPAAIRGGAVDRQHNQAAGLLWCWLIGWTLFLTAARSKLATYLWPVFPPMSILAAVVWARLLEGTLNEAARKSFARAFVWSSWTGPIVLPAAVLVVQATFAVQFDWPIWVAVGLSAAVAPLPLLPWYAGRRQASLAAATLSLAVQFVAVMTMVLPPVAGIFSARDLAEHFNRLGQVPPRLLVAEQRIGSLVFYLDPQVRAGLKEGQIQGLSADQLPPWHAGDVIALPERKLSRAGKYLNLAGTPYESVGHYRLYHITGNAGGPRR
jgi:4-amino-4-deoxy-L-arabinose transferase-like glycosyltransferase